MSIAVACLLAGGAAALVVGWQRHGIDAGTAAAHLAPAPATPVASPRRPPVLRFISARRAALWWRRLQRRITISFPFAVPGDLRSPRASEAITSLYADGLACSIGCRPFGAIDGWPLRPFHREHPLRAGLNELRPDSLHVGLDIQARDGAPVYAVQPGYARVLAPSGPDARVQVGNYVYWHVTPLVRTGQLVVPYATELGRVMGGYGHIAFSEIGRTGQYANPLRPGGRVLAPWSDRYPPVIAHPSLAADGTAVVEAFDPQSFVRRTTYLTPVLAPAALAYRLYRSNGLAATPLEFSFRGTHLLPWAARSEIFAPGAHAPGFGCFARRPLCRPRWSYWLAGGLAPPLPAHLPAGRYTLTVYAWDWADNRSAIDTVVWKSADRWRARGHVPPLPPTYLSPLRPLAPRAAIPR